MTVTLAAHQVEFEKIARRKSRFAFFAQCGTGKTIGLLNICDAIRLRTLVVAPKSTMRAAWIEDARHFPALDVRLAWHGNKAERISIIREGLWDIAVTNYETFKSHAADFLAAGVRRLIVDESSKIKNYNSAITKAVHQFADRMESVYLLSGTPAPNNPTEYWGQLRAIDKGAAGVSYWGFAHRYATPIKRRVASLGKEIISGWTQTDGQRTALAECLKPHCWFLKKTECVDLPEQSDRVIDVYLSDDERIAYENAAKSLRIELADGTVSRIKANAALTKCRQILGGQVRAAGEIVKTGSSKLNALSDLLDELGAQTPVVIWAEYTAEIDAIMELLNQRGEPSERIDGSTSHYAGAIVKRFQDGDTFRVVCQPQAAGHGITLTRASDSIYFSLGFSAEQYEQSRDRIHRVGQGRPCTYYLLIVPGTTDIACLKTVRKKMSAADAVRESVGILESKS